MMDEDLCPWRGPVPCDERDADRFFGRKDELRELLHYVTTQRLTILTAGSGAGKTSLIQAGLVPALRVWRQQAPDTMGFCLCVRNWADATKGSKSAAGSLARAIGDEIKRLAGECRTSDVPPLLGHKQLQIDLPFLVPAEMPDLSPRGDTEEHNRKALCNYVARLCDAVGNRLILIIDQAEEFMGSALSRSSGYTEVAALQAVGTLFEEERRVRILVSLREEYVARLRPLEMMVPSLVKRMYTIPPMSVNAAVEVVTRCAQQSRGHVEMPKQAAEDVVGWTLETETAAGDGGQAPVDMLSVQALLKDAYDRYPERGAEEISFQTGEELPAGDSSGCRAEKPRIFDESYLKRYIAVLKKEQERLASGAGFRLAEGPMQRLLDKVLPAQDHGRGSDEQTALARRVMARMKGFLSSPHGFKRYVTDIDLIHYAIREDLDALASDEQREAEKVLRSDEFKKMMRTMRPPREQKPSGNRDHGALKVESGKLPALPVFWQRAKQLVDAGYRVVSELQGRQHQILKYHGDNNDGDPIYSLLHDGFGPALDAWCDTARSSPFDVLASVVPTYGLRMPWQKSTIITTVRDDTKWISCLVRDANFVGVKFRSCSFVSTLFQDCTFTRCSFKDCDLCTVGFIGGTWDGVQVVGGKAAGLLLDGVVCHGDIHLLAVRGRTPSNLNSAVFRNVSLLKGDPERGLAEGKLLIQDCDAQYAQIFSFTVASPGAISAHNCDFHGALFQDYRQEDTAHFSNCRTESGINKAPEGSWPPTA